MNDDTHLIAVALATRAVIEAEHILRDETPGVLVWRGGRWQGVVPRVGEVFHIEGSPGAALWKVTTPFRLVGLSTVADIVPAGEDADALIAAGKILPRWPA